MYDIIGFENPATQDVLNYITQKESCSQEELKLNLTEISLSGLNDLKRFKNKKIQIKEIEKQSFIKHTISLDIYLSDKNQLKERDGTGLYRVCFSDASWIYYWKFFQGGSQELKTIAIGGAKGFINMEHLQRQKNIAYQIPRIGLNHAHITYSHYGMELSYYPIDKKDFPDYEVFHQSYEEVLEDVRMFFGSDGKLYSRYNKPRIRKSLMTGEPGTGKTSINLKLTREYQGSHSCVFVNDIQSIVLHLQNILNYDMPTIIIYEDCEGSFINVNSFILNFFGGIKQPNVKQGAYIVFTTNHPEQIEDRVLRNPGRIDKIFNVGPLTGNYAFQCANYYFKDFYDIKPEQTSLFEGLTGAQIAEISNSSVNKAIGRDTEIDMVIIEEVRNELLMQLREVEKMAERNSFKKRKTIGYKDGAPF